MILPLPDQTSRLHDISLQTHGIEQHVEIYKRQLALLDDSEKRDIGLTMEITKTLLRVVKRECKEKESNETTSLTEKIDIAIQKLRGDQVENYSTLMSERDTVYIKDEKHVLDRELRAKLLEEFAANFDSKANAIRQKVLKVACKSLESAKLHLKVRYKEQNKDYERIFEVKSSVCQELQREQEKFAPELEQLKKQKEDLFKKEITNIFLAAQYGDIEYIKKEMGSLSLWDSWFHKKAFIDQTYPDKDSTQFTMLQTAAWVGNLPLITLLCKHGADISKKDTQGYSAIHWAAKAGNYHIVKFLLDLDKSLVNAKGAFDRTPLMLAVYNLNYDVAELLIEREADLNAQSTKDDHQLTALHYGVEKRHIGLVKLLLSHPLTDVDVRDAADTTPLRLAVDLQHPILVEEIVKHKTCFKRTNAEERSGILTLLTATQPESEIHKILLLNMPKNKVTYGQEKGRV